MVRPAQDIDNEVARHRSRLIPEKGAAGQRLTVTNTNPFTTAFVQDADPELLDGVGDPNGIALSATTGTLFVDRTDGAPKLWQNQDGGTTWTDLTAGGAGTLPVVLDDGTFTYSIDQTGGPGNLRAQVVDNATGTFLGQMDMYSDGTNIASAGLHAESASHSVTFNVLAIDSGSPGTRLQFVMDGHQVGFYLGTSNPNGVVTAPGGSLFIDTSSTTWYRNTNGGSAWSAF